MIVTRIWMVVALTWVGVLGLLAQRPGFPSEGFRRGMLDRFEEVSPQIGEKLPDVELFDAKGQPRRLSSLKGSYTVLILGCLT